MRTSKRHSWKGSLTEVYSILVSASKSPQSSVERIAHPEVEDGEVWMWKQQGLDNTEYLT